MAFTVVKVVGFQTTTPAEIKACLLENVLPSVQWFN